MYFVSLFEWLLREQVACGKCAMPWLRGNLGPLVACGFQYRSLFSLARRLHFLMMPYEPQQQVEFLYISVHARRHTGAN